MTCRARRATPLRRDTRRSTRTTLTTQTPSSGMQSLARISWALSKSIFRRSALATPSGTFRSLGCHPAPSVAAAGTVQHNAFVHSATATFWIEWVRWEPGHGHHPGAGHGSPEYDAIRAIKPFWPEPTYLQLQYSQMVILVFNGVLWPHVTVATLTLSNG